MERRTPQILLTYRSMTGRMKISHNDRALMLYAGTLGAYLESASHTWDQDHNHSQLLAAAPWLRTHNPLFQRWLQHVNPEGDRESAMPTMETTNSNEIRPANRPDLLLDPITYDPEVHNE